MSIHISDCEKANIFDTITNKNPWSLREQTILFHQVSKRKNDMKLCWRVKSYKLRKKWSLEIFVTLKIFDSDVGYIVMIMS